MNILTELFYGNITPNTINIEPGSEYDEQTKKAERIEEKLLAILQDKEMNLFLDYINTQSAICGILSEKSFTMGFKLGTLLMAETFHGAHEILAE